MYQMSLKWERLLYRLKHLVSAPFIYAVFPAVLILHFFIELYHSACFPLYGLPYINRKEYIKIDRHKLSYLNWLEKINCMYCGYVNGTLAYAAAIAARTEKYWCPIRHESDGAFKDPSHHSVFAKFGDEKGYRDDLGSGS